jgi:hypothetical protein
MLTALGAGPARSGNRCKTSDRSGRLLRDIPETSYEVLHSKLRHFGLAVKTGTKAELS